MSDGTAREALLAPTLLLVGGAVAVCGAPLFAPGVALRGPRTRAT